MGTIRHRSLRLARGLLRLAAAGVVLAAAGSAAAQQGINLRPIGTYQAGVFAQGASEIVAHDPATQRLFVVNGASGALDVLDIQDPTRPTLLFSIDVRPYGHQANSVAVREGVVAAAVEAVDKQAPGAVVFFDADGHYIRSVSIGSLPDMLTFTPNGRKVLVANEGEPNDAYTVDPEGSVSIIDLSEGAEAVSQADVCTAGFKAFNDQTLDPSIRIYGPNASVAQDLEPEYIAVSQDSRTAWVTLQENNALATIDIEACRVTGLRGLGFKDLSLPANALDASDKDGRINIATWPVKGMYLPDGIAVYRHQDRTYLLTANEGDSRAYTGYNEEARVKDLLLDPTAFPDAAELQLPANLGRLRVTRAQGDPDHDGSYEALYSFGARSFAIWTTDGQPVYESGDALERITAAAYPRNFNSDYEANGTFDNRSDDKGPEPEAIVVANVFGRTYAFIGLERIGGVVAYDISDPSHPLFARYVNNRDFAGVAEAGTAGDLGPEGLTFIRADDSPTGSPLLVVAHEISGTTTIYEIARDDGGSS